MRRGNKGRMGFYCILAWAKFKIFKREIYKSLDKPNKKIKNENSKNLENNENRKKKLNLVFHYRGFDCYETRYSLWLD